MSLSNTVITVNNIPACRLATDDTYPLSYDALARSASPFNWPHCLPGFFTAIIDNGVTDDGWTRIIEHIRYGLIRLRTPLVFRINISRNNYRIEYKLDSNPVNLRRIDNVVRVDEGHITVDRRDMGVHVRTLKVLAMRGVSAYAASWSAPWLGWNARGHEFFTNQARIKNPTPVVSSEGWSPPHVMRGIIRNEY